MRFLRPDCTLAMFTIHHNVRIMDSVWIINTLTITCDGSITDMKRVNIFLWDVQWMIFMFVFPQYQREFKVSVQFDVQCWCCIHSSLIMAGHVFGTRGRLSNAGIKHFYQTVCICWYLFSYFFLLNVRYWVMFWIWTS